MKYGKSEHLNINTEQKQRVRILAPRDQSCLYYKPDTLTAVNMHHSVKYAAWNPVHFTNLFESIFDGLLVPDLWYN